MVPWSKNRPQYIGLVVGLTAVTLLLCIGAGPGYAVAFIVGTPLVALWFAGFHSRRMR